MTSETSDCEKRPVESHRVVTEDNYILTLFRVRPKVTNSIEKESDDGLCQTEKNVFPAALLVHGFGSCGRHWINHKSPETTLPYILANAGYDCWIANLRGTPDSKEHVNLSVDSAEFWDFSWYEMAIFDNCAMINYILDTTGNKDISYVVHSMGCAVLLATLSLKPEFCSKVKCVCAFGPAVFGKNMTNLAMGIFCRLSTFIAPYKSIYRREIFSTTVQEIGKELFPTLNEKITNLMCTLLYIYTGIFGRNYYHIQRTRVPTVNAILPASTSLKTFCHGSQCFSQDKFQQYDYGPSLNKMKYGQSTPPEIDISKVNVPFALFYSTGDELTVPVDVKKLSICLQNVIGTYEISKPEFAHIDFLVGADTESLYKSIIDIFNHFRENKP